MNDWWISSWCSQLTNCLLMGCVYQRYLKYIQEGKNFITPSPLLFCIFYCRPSSWLFHHPLLSKVFLSMTHGEARRFLINLQSQSQSQTNLLLFFHTTSNGLLICYLPIHSRHSCILKTFPNPPNAVSLQDAIIRWENFSTSVRRLRSLWLSLINSLTKLLLKSLNSNPVGTLLRCTLSCLFNYTSLFAQFSAHYFNLL